MRDPSYYHTLQRGKEIYKYGVGGGGGGGSGSTKCSKLTVYVDDKSPQKCSK